MTSKQDLTLLFSQINCKSPRKGYPILKDFMKFKICIPDKKCIAVFTNALLILCLQGLGTNDDTLIRIIVSHSEVDMVQIAHAFRRLCGKELSEWIKVK
jgi:Annexin